MFILFVETHFFVELRSRNSGAYKLIRVISWDIRLESSTCSSLVILQQVCYSVILSFV